MTVSVRAISDKRILSSLVVLVIVATGLLAFGPVATGYSPSPCLHNPNVLCKFGKTTITSNGTTTVVEYNTIINGSVTTEITTFLVNQTQTVTAATTLTDTLTSTVINPGSTITVTNAGYTVTVTDTGWTTTVTQGTAIGRAVSTVTVTQTGQGATGAWQNNFTTTATEIQNYTSTVSDSRTVTLTSIERQLSTVPQVVTVVGPTQTVTVTQTKSGVFETLLVPPDLLFLIILLVCGAGMLSVYMLRVSRDHKGAGLPNPRAPAAAVNYAAFERLTDSEQ